MISAVLVIDDSKSSRRLNLAYIQDLLGEQVNYLEASNGADGLDILESHAVDIVFLDLTMPGMSGYEVLAEIQRRKLSLQTVVISADIQRLTRERVAALGAAGFIAKPVDVNELQSMLATLGAVHA